MRKKQKCKRCRNEIPDNIIYPVQPCPHCGHKKEYWGPQEKGVFLMGMFCQVCRKRTMVLSLKETKDNIEEIWVCKGYITNWDGSIKPCNFTRPVKSIVKNGKIIRM